MAKRFSAGIVEASPRAMTPEELRRAARLWASDGEAMQPQAKAPADRHSRDAAARVADAKCLRRLSIDATARAASVTLAGNSTLGTGRGR